MADTAVLVIDVTEDAVAGIALLENKQGAEILSAHFCRLSESLSFSEALAEILDHCSINPDRCLVSVGAEHCRYRMLNVPFSDLKKVRSVVSFEIEDSVSFQSEPFVFDYLLQPAAEEGTNVFAIIARKQLIERLLEDMAEHGLDPELVTISGLPSVWNTIRRQEQGRSSFAILNIDWLMTRLFIVIDSEIKIIRSIPCQLKETDPVGEQSEAPSPEVGSSKYLEKSVKRLADDIRYSLVALEPILPEGADLPLIFEGTAGRIPHLKDALLIELAGLLGEGDTQEYNELTNYQTLAEHPQRGCFDTAIALAICKPKDRERINFRKDDYAFAGQNGISVKAVKYAAAALVFAALVVMVFQAESYRRMKLEQVKLTSQIESLYRETVPDSTPGPEPVKQLQIKVRDLNEASATGTVHNPTIDAVKVLADISSRLPASMQVSFERYIYDRKGVRIRGLTDNFNTVDQMKNRLAQSPLFSEVAIGSANVDQKANGVRFELTLQL